MRLLPRRLGARILLLALKGDRTPVFHRRLGTQKSSLGKDDETRRLGLFILAV
ncbi:MAG: hypothetical protein AB1861_09750 [Cyanobacteriota bacterium]